MAYIQERDGLTYNDDPELSARDDTNGWPGCPVFITRRTGKSFSSLRALYS